MGVVECYELFCGEEVHEVVMRALLFVCYDGNFYWCVKIVETEICGESLRVKKINDKSFPTQTTNQQHNNNGYITIITSNIINPTNNNAKKRTVEANAPLTPKER